MKTNFLKIIPLLFLLLSTGVIRAAAAATPPGDATDIIADIIAVVGLKPNFEVRSGNVPNAAAVTANGKRFIVYNPNFFGRLNQAAGNKWASVSVLAHEIGHHLNGHTLTNAGSQPSLELEADEFSGFVLEKMGATLAQAQSAMRLASGYTASHTHPAQPDRLTAIAKGFNNAMSASSSMAKYNQPVNKTDPQLATLHPMPAQQPRAIYKPQPERMATGVLARVNFPADQASTYYVTTGFNIIRVNNQQWRVLGKMIPTNSEEYPFIMKNANSTLFVNKNGKILTADKQVAGYLTMKG